MNYCFDWRAVGRVDNRRGATPALQRGIVYERKVVEAIRARFPLSLSQLPICDFATGRPVGIPDVLLFAVPVDLAQPKPASAVSIFEVKRSFFQRDVEQVERYKRYLTAMRFSPIHSYIVCAEMYDPPRNIRAVYGCPELWEAVEAPSEQLTVALVSERELSLAKRERRGLADGHNLGLIRESSKNLGAGRSGGSDSGHLLRSGTSPRT